MNNFTGSPGWASALLESPGFPKGLRGPAGAMTCYFAITTACGFRTFSFVPDKTWWEKQNDFLLLLLFFPGGLIFRMLFFLCVLCAFSCMKHMPFCDLSPLQKLKPLPFQYRWDRVCSPADLRGSVKGWPSQLQPGYGLAVNCHIKKLKLPASASLIIFPVTLFSLFFQMSYFF